MGEKQDDLKEFVMGFNNAIERTLSSIVYAMLKEFYDEQFLIIPEVRR